MGSYVILCSIHTYQTGIGSRFDWIEKWVMHPFFHWTEKYYHSPLTYINIILVLESTCGLVFVSISCNYIFMKINDVTSFSFLHCIVSRSSVSPMSIRCDFGVNGPLREYRKSTDTFNLIPVPFTICIRFCR